MELSLSKNTVMTIKTALGKMKRLHAQNIKNLRKQGEIPEIYKGTALAQRRKKDKYSKALAELETKTSTKVNGGEIMSGEVSVNLEVSGLENLNTALKMTKKLKEEVGELNDELDELEEKTEGKLEAEDLFEAEDEE